MGNGKKSRDNYEQINDVTVTRIADYDKQWTSRMNIPKMVRVGEFE
jgi:hypothetical protein